MLVFFMTFLRVMILGCGLVLSAHVVANTEDQKASILFEAIFDEWLARSPMLQADVGVKTDYDKWDNLSDAFAKQSHKMHQAQLARLDTIKVKDLSPRVSLSYKLLKQQLMSEVEHFRWRMHNYPVNQMFGWHSAIPSVLINQHTIASEEDAHDYIARLKGVEPLFNDLIWGLEARMKKGILAPKFVYPKVIEDSQNLLKGAPFDEGAPSVFLQDFTKKVSALTLSATHKKALITEANKALIGNVKPAYLRLINTLKHLEKKADDRSGVWKFPQGEAFYSAALKRTTTTGLTAEQIHSMGLAEVDRIHSEMQGIKDRVKFKGNLQAFFNFMKSDDQFYYPNTKEGKASYLKRVDDVITEMEARLGELFITKPQSELIVKPVEPYREKSAGEAFYQSPPTDGSRPGIYYVNLYNMKDRPVYKLESLAYHEALPGHHLQLSIATGLGDVPRFRKHGFYTAYIEGWGLYAELLPKEMGLYQNPYSDFGRLEMELWRACRLVVDTGLHAKKWSKEKAVKYLIENTPSSQRVATKAIERYIVLPSQATAYKVGMLKILELRKKMKAKLGSKFDIRQFHDKILRLGAVPLNVLEAELLQ